MTKNQLMVEIGKEILGLTGFKEHNGAFNSGMIEAFTRCAKLIEQLPDEVPDQDERPQGTTWQATCSFGQLKQAIQETVVDPIQTPLMPVQPEPSPIEVALRIIATGSGMNATECVGYAFKIIDAVKAEEAKRAGKP